MTTPDSTQRKDAAVKRRPDCPAWCQTSHPDGSGPHYGPHIATERNVRQPGETLRVTVLPMYAGEEGRGGKFRDPVVFTRGTRGDGKGPALFLTAADAADLADLVEYLAAMTAANHRKIAAALRQAAATIAGSPDTARTGRA